MRALVTGGGGFVAQWVIRAMLARGWEVIASGPEPAAPASADGVAAGARWRPLDVRDDAALGAALDAERPDAIVHLAAVAFPPAATADPAAAWALNVVGTVRLLGAAGARVKAGTLDPVVLVVGSSEQYGRHDAGDMPLREEAAQRPLTVYGATKAAQEVAALQAHRASRVRVVATRSFNHSGPGQGTDFLLPALVRRALDLRGAADPRLVLGDQTPVREFTHVADVAEAYCRLVEDGTAGEAYNVCSGQGTTVRELALSVLHRAGVAAEISTDPALLRPVDVPILVGSPDKLRAATGWVPARTRDDIIDDLIHAASR
ncbi:MAG TPA: GDP-mannose 4,6-dehydratase [Gemmatimonadaceae bacterium]